jgi:hypothetical protein
VAGSGLVRTFRPRIVAALPAVEHQLDGVLEVGDRAAIPPNMSNLLGR